MILGIPKNLDNYICVDSNMAEKLHRAGYMPIYRDPMKDRVYFTKCDEISELLEYLSEDIIE